MACKQPRSSRDRIFRVVTYDQTRMGGLASLPCGSGSDNFFRSVPIFFAIIIMHIQCLCVVSRLLQEWSGMLLHNSSKGIRIFFRSGAVLEAAVLKLRIDQMTYQSPPNGTVEYKLVHERDINNASPLSFTCVCEGVGGTAQLINITDW